MELLRKLDSGVARGEAWTAAGVLLAMILVAATQALLRNLTDFGFGWANDALADLEWIDPFLKKGTVWVAFLGASLATYHEKHIGIDILPRLLAGNAKRVIKSVVGIGSGVTSIGLAIVFWGAVLNNAADRPLEYEILVDGSPAHVCEADPSLLEQYEVHRPSVYCAIRGMMNAVGAEAETPEGASQFIMPVMFMIIGIRLFAQGVWSGGQLFIPAWAERAEEDERAVEAARQAADAALRAEADAMADDGGGSTQESSSAPEADSSNTEEATADTSGDEAAESEADDE